MSDYAVKKIDEMEAIYRRRLQAGAGGVGRRVVRDADHRHAGRLRETTPTTTTRTTTRKKFSSRLRGGGELEIAGERFPLDSDHIARVGPEVKRKIWPGDEGSACSSSAACRARPTKRPTSRNWVNRTRWRAKLALDASRIPVLAAALIALLLAAPAGGGEGAGGATEGSIAAPQPRSGAEADDAIVVVNGDVTVERGQFVEGVFVVNGDARIAGRVDGDVVIVSGDALVGGRIDGNLVTIAAGRGCCRPPASAATSATATSGRSSRSAADGRGSTVQKENWTDSIDLFPFIGAFVLWFAIGISAVVLGVLLLLIAPRAADAIAAQTRERIGVTIAIGFAIFIALPVAGLHRRDHPARPAAGASASASP